MSRHACKMSKAVLLLTVTDLISIVHRISAHSDLLNAGNPQLSKLKLLSLKAVNAPQLANIFRSDPQEEKTANRNWDCSAALTPTACPH